MRVSRALQAVAVLMLFAACSDKEQPTEPEPEAPDTTAVFTVTSTKPSPDTIQARSSMSVKLTTTSGQPRANSQVIFSVVPDTAGVLTDVRISEISDTAPRTQITRITDENGVASVIVRYGKTLGSARVRAVSVPYQAAVFSTYTTANPGNLASVTLTASAKLVSIGDQVTLSAVAKDRVGDVLPDTISFQTTGSVVTVSPDGVALAMSSGVQDIQAVATSGGTTVRSTPVTISVIPVLPSGSAAQVAWLYAPPSANGTFVFTTELVTGVMNQPDYTILVPSGAGAPAWQPGANKLAFQLGGSVAVRDLTTGSDVLISSAPFESWPQFSSDGAWIYFTRYINNTGQILRAHPDGTGMSVVADGESAEMATPSPDGSSVAYVANHNTIKILTLADGSTRTLASAPSPLLTPRWSPDGRSIAYLVNTLPGIPSGTLTIADIATGTTKTYGTTPWQAGMSWSPDSQWILGYAHGGTIAHVPSGIVSPVTGTGVAPAWRY